LVFAPGDAGAPAHPPAQVRPALEAVAAATAAGGWAFGFLAYEAAAGLDPVLPVVSGAGPLLWFGIGPRPAAVPVVDRPAGPRATAEWTLADDLASYGRKFGAVRRAIADGLTYECNLTTRATGTLTGSVDDLYAQLSWAQRGRYGGLIRYEDCAVVSASPELFFEWRGGQVRTRPMKGTARRQTDPEEDLRARERLLRAEKERAENVIVVDLLRNDLSRVASAGGVRVHELLSVEAYETVWQLTSEIHADLRPEVGLVEILQALFPCGSVTGAPKPATMRLIRDVEVTPRGVYCGAMGFVAPPTAPVRARFNVAIRTVVADLSTGMCCYGVGGGITWGSDLRAEFDELHAKAAVLTDALGAAAIDAATRTAASVRATS
jgi:para-aminobenzoate synthetase/4-amino-4-deoxychorismate lyase